MSDEHSNEEASSFMTMPGQFFAWADEVQKMSLDRGVPARIWPAFMDPVTDRMNYAWVCVCPGCFIDHAIAQAHDCQMTPQQHWITFHQVLVELDALRPPWVEPSQALQELLDARQTSDGS